MIHVKRPIFYRFCSRFIFAVLVSRVELLSELRDVVMRCFAAAAHQE
jgi:hypothetical protein